MKWSPFLCYFPLFRYITAASTMPATVMHKPMTIMMVAKVTGRLETAPKLPPLTN